MPFDRELVHKKRLSKVIAQRIANEMRAERKAEKEELRSRAHYVRTMCACGACRKCKQKLAMRQLRSERNLLTLCTEVGLYLSEPSWWPTLQSYCEQIKESQKGFTK